MIKKIKKQAIKKEMPALVDIETKWNEKPWKIVRKGGKHCPKCGEPGFYYMKKTKSFECLKCNYVEAE